MSHVRLSVTVFSVVELILIDVRCAIEGILAIRLGIVSNVVLIVYLVEVFRFVLNVKLVTRLFKDIIRGFALLVCRLVLLVRECPRTVCLVLMERL